VTATAPDGPAADPRAWLAEVEEIDLAVYRAIATTPTPRLDGAMRRLSSAADYSRLSLASAALLATAGGSRGRRAAMVGLSCLGTTAAIVNLVFKPVGRRQRPDQAGEVPAARQIPLPGSRSFPSGHTAAAWAFASGVGRVLPAAGVALHSLAAVVGYSRVHTGVHYPGDVVAGALLGAMIADFTAGQVARRVPQLVHA
jgi:membrane-associated phospholipid phosphatase